MFGRLFSAPGMKSYWDDERAGITAGILLLLLALPAFLLPSLYWRLLFRLILSLWTICCGIWLMVFILRKLTR